MNRRISWFTHSVAFALYLALALPEPAQAYIGPGAGITAIGTVIALIGERESATLAEVRDALETNRRSAQALLETLDRLGVTRRQGDARVLREDYRNGGGAD